MEDMTIDDYLAMEEEQMMEEPDWDEEAFAEPAGQSPVKIATQPQPVPTNVAQQASNQQGINSVVFDTGRLTGSNLLDRLSAVDTQTKKKQLNPREFALAMQEERRKALGGDGLGSGATPSKTSASATKMVKLEAESMIHTAQPLFKRCPEAHRYVHSRPPAMAEIVLGSPPREAASSSVGAGFITCVLADGSKAYLYKRGAEKSNSDDRPAVASSPVAAHQITSTNRHSSTSAAGSLLSKPIAELMKEADALKVKALLLKESLLAERLEREQKQQSAEPALFQASQSAAQPDSEHDGESNGEGDLWVDKYAPKSFTQLLSPEKINREVLKALKKWDRFVFKTDNHQGGDHADGAASTSTLSGLSGSAVKPKKAAGSSTLGSALGAGAADGTAGEDTRPYNKVILLCGPPGTGKTTLAHIVARHCGYTPIEVNASDDRSPERLRELIHNATQNATLHAQARPNCVILDEIDGIDGSRNALDVLTAIVKAPLKSGTPATKGAKAATTFPLTRPLICICNDQYAPALRDLIKLADVFVFSAPQDVRLVQRLRQVCKQEGLQVGNSGFLAELCSATGGDIRSSINNLQFAALKSKSMQQQQQQGGAAGAGAGGRPPTTKVAGAEAKSLDIGAVLQSMIRSGLKDDTLDLAQVWKQMFTLASPNTTQSTPTTATTEGESALELASAAAVAVTKAQRVDHSMRAMDAMMAFGDHQQVIGGIFENVHSMEALDPNMNKHTAIAEWLSLADEIGSFMPRARDGFQLMPYASAVAAAVYSTCAVPAARRPRVEWPRKDREMHFKSVQRQNILQSFKEGCSIHCLQEPKQRLVLDILGHLVDVISPPAGVRALPFITLPVPEQLAIHDIVRVMESCGISYVLSKTIDADSRHSKKDGFKPFNPYQSGNTMLLKLDPAIDQLLEYSECDELASRHTPVSQEMRQLLQTEQRKLSIQIKAHTLSGEGTADAMDVAPGTAPTSVTAAHVPAPQSSATEASTPFLIMQQQQRDSALLQKRQHSGALGSFFTRTAAPASKKAKTTEVTATDTAPSGTAATDTKKASFSAAVVRFKFNQGFSNAVKRPVLMDEFL